MENCLFVLQPAAGETRRFAQIVYLIQPRVLLFQSIAAINQSITIMLTASRNQPIQSNPTKRVISCIHKHKYSVFVLLLIIAVGATLVGCQIGGVFNNDVERTLPTSRDKNQQRQRQANNQEEKNRAEAQRALQLQRDRELQIQEDLAIPVDVEDLPAVVDAKLTPQAGTQQTGGRSDSLSWILEEPLLKRRSLKPLDEFYALCEFWDRLGTAPTADVMGLEKQPLRTPIDDTQIFWKLSEIPGRQMELIAPGRIAYHPVLELPPTSPAGHLMTDAELKRVFKGAYFWTITSRVPHLRDQIFDSLPPWILELGAWYQWIKIVLEVDQDLYGVAYGAVHKLPPGVRGFLANQGNLVDLVELNILRWSLHLYVKYHEGHYQPGNKVQSQTIDAEYAFNPQNWGRLGFEPEGMKKVKLEKGVPQTVGLVRDQLLPILKRMREEYLRMDQEARGA